MSELLNPRNDFVFKRIFGSEENKDVLLAFLNRTFTEAGGEPLSEITLLNPYTDKDEVLEMNEPTLKKAMTSLEYLSQDREARLRYEERQKFLHDEASAMEWALEKGMQQGIEKGMEKGLQEGERRKALKIAKGLLEAGVSIELIAETTGLTKEEISSLK